MRRNLDNRKEHPRAIGYLGICFFILLIVFNIPQLFTGMNLAPYSEPTHIEAPKGSDDPGIDYEVEWDKLWNWTEHDTGRDIEIDIFNNTYIAASTNVPRGAILLKYDSDGNLLWNSTWNSQTTNLECYGVAVSKDGESAYLTGYFLNSTGMQNDVFIAKFHSNGTLDWERYWGGLDNNDYAFDIVTDYNGDIYITGDIWNTVAPDPFNISVTKFYSNSTFAWTYNWNGLGDSSDSPEEIAVDSDNNVYVCGQTYGDSDNNIITLKFNSSGILEWEQYWNGTLDSYGEGLVIDNNDNLYVVGRTNDVFSISGDMDAVILKYNSSGQLLWERRWGMGTNDERFTAVTTIGENIYCLGQEHKESTIWNTIIVEFKSNGNNFGHLVIDGSDYYDPNVRIATDGNNLYLIGRDYDVPSGNDVLLVKCRPIIDPDDIPDIFVDEVHEIFTPDGFNITFRFSDKDDNDILGATVNYWWNETDFTGNMTELGSGLYMLNFTSIPVLPTEDPILLEMTVSKTGFNDRYYEKEIAVDPDVMKPGDVSDILELFDEIINFIQTPSGIIVIVGVIGGVVVVIVINNKKKKK